MKALGELHSLLASQYHDRAITHARRGAWEHAEADLDRVISIIPEDASAVLTRARIRYHQGRRGDAMAELDVAERLGAAADVVNALRESIIADDARRRERSERRERDRQARGAFVSATFDRIHESVSSMTGRECAYLAMGVAFVAAVLIWELGMSGGVG